MTSLLIANIIQASNFCRLIETVINSHIRESLFAMMNLLTNNPDEIVRLITETHEQLSKQRDLCQEAEFQLEKYYSSAILELSKN